MFLSLLLFSQIASSSLISTSVGRVKDHVLTSREVGIHFYIENALSNPARSLQVLKVPGIETRAFSDQVSKSLLEQVVYIESQNFPVAKVSDADLSSSRSKANQRLSGVSGFKELEATPEEVERIVRQHLQAKKFIQFKENSSTVPVTDAEARDYYESNKLRFGNLPFENFKDNIKAYLTKTQSEKRLKEWYEVLQSKYKVRNFLAEI